MTDINTLATIASIISGFGVAMLFFRIQRELQMHKEMEPNWIPWADRLLIGATIISLLLVLLPIVALRPSSPLITKLASAACSASVIMVTGYIFGILAHYRLIFGKKRNARNLRRNNPEPAERWIVWSTILIAVAVCSWVY